MGRKSKFSSEVKLEAVLKYLNNEGSYASISSNYGIDWTTLREWVKNYNAIGSEGLTTNASNNRYTTELKKQIVKEYLNSEASYLDLSKKYKIPSKRTIIDWVMKYNSHEYLKTTGTGGYVVMTKGRKTTFDERIKIVEHCIENKYNYAETAQEFSVSYQQVYNWVKKYNNSGIEGLQDRREKKKLRMS